MNRPPNDSAGSLNACTPSTQLPHSAAPARAGAVRRVSVPIPLLPALMRSLRAASVFLTSPSKSKRLRSGTLRLYYTSKQTTGETNPETHWGTRNRPRPRKTTAPVPGSPDPSCLPPKHDRPRRTNDRGKCTAPAAHTAPYLPAGKPARPGEPGKPPKARVSPVPPDPLPPFPRPRARCARHNRLPYRADPGHHGNQHTGPPTPRHRPPPASAETAPRRRRRALPSTKRPLTGGTRPPSTAAAPCSRRQGHANYADTHPAR